MLAKLIQREAHGKDEDKDIFFAYYSHRGDVVMMMVWFGQKQERRKKQILVRCNPLCVYRFSLKEIRLAGPDQPTSSIDRLFSYE